jgi:hypothetical protein
MLGGLKQHWRDLRKTRPGHRFQDRYKRNRRGREGELWRRRFLKPAIGVLLLCGGLILCFIPGPGLPLVLVGATLLAERSRPIARAMDWCELKLRKVLRRAKTWWCQASLGTRNAVLAAAAFMIAGAGYGAYHFIINR